MEYATIQRTDTPRSSERPSRSVTGICRAPLAKKWVENELDLGMDMVEFGKSKTERESGLRKARWAERTLVACGVVKGPAKL